jgi:myo-inositol-1(or 4)-monophosphatase
MQDTITKALLSSGKILMDSLGKLTEIKEKQDQSNVATQADLDSERNIVAIIEKKFPSHNILAEETGFRNKFSEYTWVIDPLDGSSNFAAGLPWFGILIAVMKDYKPIAAGIYLPFYDLIYGAEKGKGAFRNKERINVTNAIELRNVLFSYSLDYSEDISKTDMESKIIKELVNNTRNLRAVNSVVEYCYVADGRIGGCINQTTHIWDIAAPDLIIREAGGVVSDISGSEIDYRFSNSDYGRNFTFVASNKELHPKVLGLIRIAISQKSPRN